MVKYYYKLTEISEVETIFFLCKQIYLWSRRKCYTRIKRG